MALIKSVRGFTPKIGKDCFIAENATLVGDVTMGDECSIWFSTVLRGDVNTITIGDRVNIQDGSVLHTLYQKSVIEIGNDVSVGHNVTIHGAKVCDYALIGMGSVLLDGVEVLNLNPRHDSHNDLALAYAEEHHLLMTAGSDCHRPGDEGTTGILAETLPEDSFGYADLIRSGKYTIIRPE
jgi:bifunctional N-acetylglucosamine-1-phosphate-uridyltransferase/glucosamine-1-phosphate-acetyltransferase GlmU-like protein